MLTLSFKYAVFVLAPRRTKRAHTHMCTHIHAHTYRHFKKSNLCNEISQVIFVGSKPGTLLMRCFYHEFNASLAAAAKSPKPLNRRLVRELFHVCVFVNPLLCGRLFSDVP